jgi:hypothetical protein
MELKAPQILAEPLCDTAAVAEAFNVSTRVVATPEFQRRNGLTPIVLGPRLIRFRRSDVRRVAGESPSE